MILEKIKSTIQNFRHQWQRRQCHDEKTVHIGFGFNCMLVHKVSFLRYASNICCCNYHYWMHYGNAIVFYLVSQTFIEYSCSITCACLLVSPLRRYVLVWACVNVINRHSNEYGFSCSETQWKRVQKKKCYGNSASDHVNKLPINLIAFRGEK